MLLIFLILFYVSASEYVYVLHACRCPQRREDGVRSTGAEDTGKCELPEMGTVKNLGPWQQHQCA